MLCSQRRLDQPHEGPHRRETCLCNSFTVTGNLKRHIKLQSVSRRSLNHQVDTIEHMTIVLQSGGCSQVWALFIKILRLRPGWFINSNILPGRLLFHIVLHSSLLINDSSARFYWGQTGRWHGLKSLTSAALPRLPPSRSLSEWAGSSPPVLMPDC